MFIVAKSMTGGLRAAVGAAKVLTAWPSLHLALRIGGALFLLWLAWQAWRATVVSSTAAEVESTRSLFGQDVTSTLLNPQVGVFFLMFLPQFAEPARGHLVWQLALLGLGFVASWTLVNLAHGALASRAALAFARSVDSLVRVKRLGAAVLGLWMLADVIREEAVRSAKSSVLSVAISSARESDIATKYSMCDG